MYCRAVEKLLARAGSILNVPKSDGFTTIHIAAINDHREIAKLLLKQVRLHVCSSCMRDTLIRGLVSKETGAASRLFSENKCFVLSTEMIRGKWLLQRDSRAGI